MSSGNVNSNKTRKFRLHLACEDGNLEKVKKIAGKDKRTINVFDEKHWTPLHCAANSRHLEICAFLLKNGADPNAATSNNTTVIISFITI